MKKKTTLMIEESVYEGIRIRAARERKSVSDVVAEAMRKYLSGPEKEPKKITLPVASGKLDLPPHIDVNKTSELLDYLDECDIAEGRRPSQL